MKISSKTKPFAVLGHPIGHSLSPVMHNAAFAALDMNAVYLAFDVHPDRLMSTLPVMADLGFGGINLTVPLKEVAYRGISCLGESAKALGSVNTVKIGSGGLEGYSTDGEGFLRGIREAFDLSVEGLSIFVLGCGGAGRAVAVASAVAGADRLMLTDHDMNRAGKLESEIAGLASKVQAQTVASDLASWTRASLESDLVVHATPVGMRCDEDSLLGADAFRAGQAVYDLIYMFPETALMKVAREAGARVSNGLDMLLFQGVLSFSIWTGRDAPVEKMRQTLEQAVYGKK
ncbi:shikimate dehydrogenase [Verrucomicrobiota bacterium]